MRAVFLKENAAFPAARPGQVMEFFHVLEGVAMVRGSVVTPEGKLDETLYSSCADGEALTYYWRTAAASRVSAVRLTEEACAGDRLLALAPRRSPPSPLPGPRPWPEGRGVHTQKGGPSAAGRSCMRETLFTAAGGALPALPWPDYPRPRLRRQSF